MNMSAFDGLPVAKKSLDQAAADRLRDAVVNARIAPGSRLTEVNLATEFGLSRGTIRAAFQRLVSEGLMVQLPYTGWEVRKLTAQDAWELYTLRSSLEGLAARLAAERMDDAGRAKVRAADAALRAAADSGLSASVTDADLGLHKTIVHLSEHQRLIQHYGVLEHQIRMYIASTNEMTGDGQRIVETHRAIIKAVLDGDPDAAERCIHEHNVYYGTMLVKLLSSRIGDAADA